MRERLAVMLLAVACGSEPPLECGKTVGDDYFPLARRSIWTFIETAESGIITPKTWILREATEKSFVFFHREGTPREVWNSRDDSGRIFWNRKINYLEDEKTAVTDIHYDVGGRLRLDPEHHDPGDWWIETSTETTITVDACAEWTEKDWRRCLANAKTIQVKDTWSVTSTGSMTVLGTTYDDVLCQRRIEENSDENGLSSTKEYCWARGAGKIFESDPSNKIEELGSFCAPQQ